MIGITSTIPQEIIWASNEQVVDLNNLFIQGDSSHFIDIAERNGFPGNICAWIKGIYGVIKELEIKTVIGIAEGDCSTTKGLMEVLENEGIEVIPFSYPLDKDQKKLQEQMDNLIKSLGTNNQKVSIKFNELNSIRKSISKLDQIAIDGTIPSHELYLWQLSASDFNGNPDKYKKELLEYITNIKKRTSLTKKSFSIGYIGVPAIQPQIFELIEELGARVNYFEIPRQFSMIPVKETIIDSYLDYTYPYNVSNRVADIKQAIKQRNLKGLIHYTQSFCYRQIEDIVFKRELEIPILTLEMDRPGVLDNRTRLRLESFIESLDS